MSKWDSLPNAAHIDWVIASVRTDPQPWDAAREADRTAIRDAARTAIREAARGEALAAAFGAALVAAWDAIAALIAWDDCAHILDMPADAVKTLAACGHHAAVLLYPAVLVKSNR